MLPLIPIALGVAALAGAGTAYSISKDMTVRAQLEVDKINAEKDSAPALVGAVSGLAFSAALAAIGYYLVRKKIA